MAQFRRFGRANSAPLGALFFVLLARGLISPALAEGAFAMGRDSARLWYGSSTNERSVTTSIQLAMTRCQQQSPNCQLVRQFKLGCFALAIPEQTNAAGVATGATKADAEGKALNFCRQTSVGRSCTVRHSFCDAIDGPLTQLLMQRQEAEALARRVDVSAQTGSACSLSAKAISYAHRRCVGGTCDAKLATVEVVGKSVLEYAGGKAGNRGIQFELGRTLEVSHDFAATRQADPSLPSNEPRPGTASRDFATASYDGQTLTTYLTLLTLARSHPSIPDNTLLGALFGTTRIRIDSCSTCTVTEYSLVGHTVGGPVSLPGFLNAPIVEQSCKIESMK